MPSHDFYDPENTKVEQLRLLTVRNNQKHDKNFFKTAIGTDLREGLGRKNSEDASMSTSDTKKSKKFKIDKFDTKT